MQCTTATDTYFGILQLINLNRTLITKFINYDHSTNSTELIVASVLHQSFQDRKWCISEIFIIQGFSFANQFDQI